MYKNGEEPVFTSTKSWNEQKKEFQLDKGKIIFFTLLAKKDLYEVEKNVSKAQIRVSSRFNL